MQMWNEVGPLGRNILQGRHPSENARTDDTQGPFQFKEAVTLSLWHVTGSLCVLFPHLQNDL